MSGRYRQQGLYIDTGNPATVNESTPFAPGQIGKQTSFHNDAAQNGVATFPNPIDIQYVKRYATDTVAIVAGDCAFWQDTDNNVVTAEFASAVGGTTAPLLAGVFIGSSLAGGNYGFIQVGGVGPVRLADSTAVATVGANLVWSTNREVKQDTVGTTTLLTRQVLGVLRTLTTVTGTHVSAEAVINPARLGW
jgi:hypothetical protein